MLPGVLAMIYRWAEIVRTEHKHWKKEYDIEQRALEQDLLSYNLRPFIGEEGELAVVIDPKR